MNDDAKITLSGGGLKLILRETAARAMSRTSGLSSEYAASCREVADEIVEAIDDLRFSTNNYDYLAEHEKSVS